MLESENEVSYSNHEHQEILILQHQLILISYRLPLSSQRKCQQETVFSQYDQKSKSIDNLPLYLTDFHPFFIDPFEKYLESVPSRNIVNSLTLAHNNDKFMEAIVSKISFPWFGMSSSLLNPFQLLIEMHQGFYDPIEIQLEREFLEKVIINKPLTVTIHFKFRFIFLGLILFVFLLLMIDLYIHAGIKMLTWLDWKYDYTYSCFLH